MFHRLDQFIPVSAVVVIKCRANYTLRFSDSYLGKAGTGTLRENGSRGEPISFDICFCIPLLLFINP